MFRFTKVTSWIVMAALLSATACKKEEKQMMEEMAPAPTGSLKVDNQTISQNTVIISEITLSDPGWVVVHADNGQNAPVVPDIISTPVWLDAGTHTQVEVPLKKDVSFSDGDLLWAMLHTDSGVMGTYEFDGQSDADGPILNADEMIVMENFTISSASITVQDQPVTNNTITIASVNAAADGWLVVHNDDGTGNIVLPDIIGKVQVQKGVNTNVTITLDGSKTYTSGQLLFPMLHLDNGQIGVYEFDGSGQFDGPEIFGNEPFPANVIFTSLTVQ